MHQQIYEQNDLRSSHNDVTLGATWATEKWQNNNILWPTKDDQTCNTCANNYFFNVKTFTIKP